MKQELTEGAVALVEQHQDQIFESIEPNTDFFMKPSWWDKTDVDAYKRTGEVRQVVKAFLTGTLDRMVAGYDRHIYTTKNNGTELWLFKNNRSLKLRLLVAKRTPSGVFVGNSSSLVGMRQAPNKTGRRKIYWGLGGRSMIQGVLEDVMPMIPFRTLKEARLDIESLSVVEKGSSETIDRGEKTKSGKKIMSHYTGGLLFKIDIRTVSRGLLGKNEEYYLFDIDRNDLAMKNFNPFLSKLGRPCTSIADAYESMKPDEVRDAERFMKKPCPRQGEWFFIPQSGRHEQVALSRAVLAWSAGPKVQAELRAKGNRAHYVTDMSEDGMVRGKVYHGGHEHLPIELKGWHKPVPNLATESFKITGAVD